MANEEVLNSEVVPEDEGNLVDEAEADDTVVPHRYDITSFGADYDVDGLVKRLNRGDIFIPAFQREFIWSHREASRFIESLLLGLPVPGVILAREAETNKLLVIDGQQRLKTLQFFFDGYLNPREGDATRRVFKLIKVQSRYDGKTYESLEERDRIHLNDSIIHATIVKQDQPEEDDTSIYHIFERLNTAGRRLFPHEIRLAVSYGPLIDSLKSWNDLKPWRDIFGAKNKRLKDQELILRFLALFEDSTTYRRPMAEFLNLFAKKNRNPGIDRLRELENRFASAIELAHNAIGARAFRTGNALNAAIYDAVMVGLARRLGGGPITDIAAVNTAYVSLLQDPDFIKATSRATADEAAVTTRLEKATTVLAAVQ